MNWKLKAAIQRTCAAMPIGSEAIYYSLQRTLGLLRDPDRPLMMLKVAARLAQRLARRGFDLGGKRVLEVGTGWRVDLPIGLHLAGAKTIDTYDLNRLLKPRLVMAAVARIAERRGPVLEAFAEVAERQDVERRLDALAKARDVQALLRTAGIHYHAPSDATRIDRPAGSVDLHLSFTVFQQIPFESLLSILRESSRLLAPEGLAWHQADLSDQFAHADPSISRANFLRFSDEEWAKYGGNRFGYHNRLRAADYERLYREAGHEILDWNADIDARSLAELASGFPLAAKFRGLPVEMLATDTIRVTSRPIRTGSES